MGAINKILGHIINLFVFGWDFGLAFLNLITPKLKPGHVVPSNAPGHGLKWPEYVPPREGDSRSACPMLNAMCNHGILPHDGKNITFKQLNTSVRQTFNFASSFCFFVPKFAADFLDRSYWSGRFDMAELSKHNAIEHDGSLFRQDATLVPDQSVPDQGLIREFFEDATGTTADGGARLTNEDLSRALSRRRFEARASNPHYSESFFHNFFGSSNSSTMLTLFAGSVDDLKPMLVEERFSENWEPRVLSRFGLTMARFNATVISVERGVDAKKYEQEKTGKVRIEDRKPAPASVETV